MPNVGPLELVVVLVVALLVLGPKRLPEVGRSLGNGIREFKDSISGESTRDQDDVHLDVEDPPKAVTTAAATAPVAPDSEEQS
ncbi:MAG: sec-independent protein translocase protein TatA [Thermoleophilaceae bacterium]|jgi:sec-independent protein translocase protein TatA|nr:sec-independent protein translocase protein TatA [Thermoleophilaceae bacterium]